MTKKATLLLILFCVVAGLFGEVSILLGLDIPNLSNLVGYANAFAQLFAIIFMLSYGTTYSLKVFKPLIVIFAIPILIGVMMKIMHWPYANQFIFIGCYGIVLLYAIVFFRKKLKIASDYLKIAWVVAFFGLTPLSLIHLIGKELLYIPPILFMILFTVFVWEQWKENALEEDED